MEAQFNASDKENPMSLGVLNNLSAIYAENNLNNSNNSLSTVLQQLSSGSKINSGADDAAGLSLVNGLEANQTALTQSQTNASEGVALLKVADGALSQVTNLLNRAVTLATEASNGSLTGSQYTAANQEYQSILDEVNNIGTTTTYNQQAVFNSVTNIYTGDSSAAGASINSLNIRSLSSSNVGDSAGTMAYSTGQTGGNVFIDLANGATDANVGDTLNTGGITTLAVHTLTASGAAATTNITVGTGTSYANTGTGLISAINAANLGVTASWTTAAVAGDSNAAAQTDHGIMITGSVGNAANPTSSSFSGTVTTAGAANGDTLGGSITLQVGTGVATQISMSAVNTAEGGSTLDDLKKYINADSALGVTAGDTVAGKLTLQSTNASLPPLTVNENLVDSTVGKNMSYTATSAYSDGLTTGLFGGTGVTDSSSGQAAVANLDLDSTSSGGGIATISYSDAAGQSLVATDLNNQSDAETTLTALNTAISDVAAQDGYIGAQINTLTAASQVLSTQQENITSAQNAVQATDYATATSNMSKYEILSQTGISALAQANSVQQEVTKLLQ
jgi:flagellin